ncbi:nose resistant to fluoxetine protein 6-like isoform X2 [Leptopilina heterotoma]|nr:nose resistant to fluoxetine protein 6-like isoform X2 [Leptopilina heterotoma]
MLDSSTKVPSGILAANIIDFGWFDQCMSVQVIKDGSNILGNHCTYTLYFSYKNQSIYINPIMSICLPLSCTENDLNQVLHKRLEEVDGYQKYQIWSNEVLCSTAPSPSIKTGAVIFITISTVIVVILLIATILDLATIKRNQWSKFSKRICKFSIRKYFTNIISLKDGDNSISVLHGLRATSTLSIVMGHGLLMKSFQSIANPLEFMENPPHIMILGTFVIYSVETFFTISGFLVSYIFCKKYMSSTKKFKLFSYYLHRYIRLTPAIAALLFSSMFCTYLFISGPKFRKISKDFIAEACEDKWWSVLLYVNNMVDKDKYCMAHLWSTAVDSQLFLISPIILIPLVKRPKFGLSFLGLLIIVSIIIPAVITAVNEYPFFINHEVGFERMMESFRNLYTQTYARASPWLIGVLLGYIVNKSTKDLTKNTIIFWWTFTIISFLFCFIGLTSFYLNGYKYNVIWESIYCSLSRPLWSIGISWIIYASIHGYGGIVTKFLSLPIFYPISRLSFCIYLVHIMNEALHYQTIRTPIYFTIFSTISELIVDIVEAVIIACFWSIIFELPAQTLEKILSGRNKR